VEDRLQDLAGGGLAFQNQPLKENNRKKKSVLKKTGYLYSGDHLSF
jgi:hypothetical protein